MKNIKIISLVPSITELLVDLGLEENIIGITKFCIHPKELKENKIIVGGTKNINFEKIKKLKPDIILCNKEENTKKIVESCEKITETHVSDIFTINDTLELIKLYGKMFDSINKANKIINGIELKLADFQKFNKNKEVKKVAYFIWKKPWMVAAKNTFINHLLTINKFENIYKNKNRYPEIDINEINIYNPDFIFLSSEPYPFKEKDLLEIKSVVNKAKVILVDGEMFSWYGSRLIKAFDYFKELHKEIKFKNNDSRDNQ